jgi:hypothetical protein
MCFWVLLRSCCCVFIVGEHRSPPCFLFGAIVLVNTQYLLGPKSDFSDIISTKEAPWTRSFFKFDEITSWGAIFFKLWIFF